MSEIDSRWTKDVQQREGPAGSNCTEYSVYYQQHGRFKATCSLTVSITVTSYTSELYNTMKVGKKLNMLVLKEGDTCLPSITLIKDISRNHGAMTWITAAAAEEMWWSLFCRGFQQTYRPGWCTYDNCNHTILNISSACPEHQTVSA